MLTLKKVKEMVKAPAHTKRVPSPKVLLEEGRIFLRKEFEHGSHLTLYHNGYVWFSAGKRNTVFHIHDCRGDYAYGASKGKGEVIKEEYFENCEWHIDPLRSRINLPRCMRTAFSKMVQQPRIVFVLDAPADVIYSRKKELTLDEIQRQLEEFDKLSNMGDNFYKINANQTPEKMVLDAKKIILDKFCLKIQK